MDNSPRNLLLNGKFAELKSFLEKNETLSLMDKAEIASQLTFQAGQLKDPAKADLIIKIANPLLLQFLPRLIIQSAEQLFFRALFIFRKKSLEQQESFYLSNVVHYRYTDFKTGLAFTSRLIAIAKVNRNQIRLLYYKGLFGHFLVLNGRVRDGIKLLTQSEKQLKLIESRTHAQIDSDLIHQYLSEVSAMLSFHLSFIGDYKTSSVRFNNLLSNLSLKSYFWVELFTRSMRMNESLDTLNGSLLYSDITHMKRLLGPKNATK